MKTPTNHTPNEVHLVLSKEELWLIIKALGHQFKTRELTKAELKIHQKILSKI